MTRIAVVNDDTVFLAMMAAVLQEQQYDVRIYREADHAFEQLRADLPEVIIETDAGSARKGGDCLAKYV